MSTARRLTPNQHRAEHRPPSSPAQRAHKPAVTFCVLSCSCFRSLNIGTCKTLKGNTSLHFSVLGASPASQVPALLLRLLAIASLSHSTAGRSLQDLALCPAYIHHFSPWSRVESTFRHSAYELTEEPLEGTGGLCCCGPSSPPAGPGTPWFPGS